MAAKASRGIKADRNLGIDLIKFIAMLMVLLLHTGVVRESFEGVYFEVNDIYYIAGIAMPLFFMVSGYLYADKKVTFKYCIYKILKILRFTFLMSLFFHLGLYIIRNETFISFVKSLFYNFIFGFVQVGQFSVFWYFGAMIIIYALLPLIQKLIHSRYLPYCILFLFIINSLICVLNVGFSFEKQYVRQPFRLWYWLFYFLLGSYVKIYSDKFNAIRPWYSIIACIAFVILGRVVDAGGNEFLFGSLPCVLYATFTFTSCLNLRLTRYTLLLKICPPLFLPVYASHMFFLIYFFGHKFMRLMESSLPCYLALGAEYITASLCIILACFLFMKIPYMDKIFKI